MEHDEFVKRIEAIKERLYRTAVLYLHSEDLALEAVDEAVYRALKAQGKLRQPEFFETWITRILINECHKELRRRRREETMDVLPESADAEAYDSFPLREALCRLPTALREVVILRYFTGLTLQETAATLGIPPGTAATRQRRALELLRLDLLKED